MHGFGNMTPEVLQQAAGQIYSILKDKVEGLRGLDVDNRESSPEYQMIRAFAEQFVDSALSQIQRVFKPKKDSPLHFLLFGFKRLHRATNTPTLTQKQYDVSVVQNIDQIILPTAKAVQSGKGVSIDEDDKVHPHKVFKYKGFQIVARDLSDSMIRKVLGAVDHAYALFKRRGVEPVFLQTVKRIEIRHARAGFSGGNLGAYYGDSGTLLIQTRTLDMDAVRIKDLKALTEVIVHEIGHALHLNYLPKDAKNYWDSAWQGADYSGDRGESEILAAALERSRGDLPLAFRDLTTYHRDALLRILQSRGFVVRQGRGYRWDTRKDAVVEVVSDLRRGRLSPELKNALHQKVNSPDLDSISKSLQIPTTYGESDHMEDFAETFLWFVFQPQKLSETALFRMRRTLSLSNLYGKGIVRLASRVVGRYMR